MQVHLFGRDGGARILMPEFRKEDSVRVFTEIAGQQVDIAPRVPSTPWGDDYALEIRHFVDCIRDGTETLALGEQGVRLMRIVDALYRSAATGRQVLLGEVAHAPA